VKGILERAVRGGWVGRVHPFRTGRGGVRGLMDRKPGKGITFEM